MDYFNCTITFVFMVRLEPHVFGSLDDTLVTLPRTLMPA